MTKCEMYRLKLGLSREELARAVPCNRATVERLEHRKGGTSALTLSRIGKALGIEDFRERLHLADEVDLSAEEG